MESCCLIEYNRDVLAPNTLYVLATFRRVPVSCLHTVGFGLDVLPCTHIKGLGIGGNLTNIDLSCLTL
jgi:hypothetical protein